MPRHPTIIRTRRKQVFLTPEARTTIQAWADREGMSFSAAIEALARSGLRRAPAAVAPPGHAPGATGPGTPGATPGAIVPASPNAPLAGRACSGSGVIEEAGV
jgi:hypothetical protein